MKKQALSLAVVIAGSYPVASNALSLGDIQSNSNLNQPLRAKIELLSTTPQEAQQLQVRLAPANVFSRVGIDRPAFLDSLRFTSSLQNGKPVILISSDQPMTEPFVNFLVEVSWPQGQLLKEYTVMLDPPVLMQPGTALASNEAAVRAEPRPSGVVNRPQQPAARAAQPTPQARQPQQAQGQAEPAPQVSAASTQASTRPASGQGSRTYRVRAGDTLFKVASRMVEPGATVDQMMMALYRANPQAFIDNNINGLKNGVTLKAPTAGTAQSISRPEARRQVRQQYAEWQKFRSNLARNTTPQESAGRGRPSSGTSTTTTASTPSDQARLEVLGSKDKAGANDQVTAAGKARLDELEKELALAKESLSARQRETDDLKSRVDELESVLKKKNRLLSLRDDQLAQLQQQLGGKGVINPPLGSEGVEDASTNTTNTGGATTPPDAGMSGNVPSTPPATGLEAGTTITPPTDQPATPNTALTPPEGTTVPGDLQNHMGSMNGDPGAVVRTDPTTLQDGMAGNTPPPVGMEGTTVTPPVGETPAETIRPTPTEPIATATTEQPKPASPFVEDEQSGGLMGLLTSPLIWKIGAGALLSLLLLGLLYYLLGKRKAAKAAGKPGDYQEANFDLDESRSPSMTAKGSGFDANAYGDLEQELDKAEGKTRNFGLEDSFDNASNTNTAASTTTVTTRKNPQDDDEVLMEANVYIAYGLHQQAESELKKALEKYPDNLDYRHKLLENYFAANNREGFDEQAQIFANTHGAQKSSLWTDVMAWGSKISPDNNLYRSGSTAATGLGAAAVATTAAATTAFASSPSATQGIEADFGDISKELDNLSSNNLGLDDFEFNLDDLERQLGDDAALAKASAPAPVASTPTAPVAPPPSTPNPASDGLDFDLDAMMSDLPDLTSPATRPQASGVKSAAADIDIDGLMNDLSNDDGFDLPTPATKPAVAAMPQTGGLDMSFDETLDLDFSTPAKPAASKPAAPAAAQDNLLDFGLDDFNMDELPPATGKVAAAATAAAGVAAAGVAGLAKAAESTPNNVTSLNLHLDNDTGIKKILPQDTFYTTPENTDQDVDTWLGDIDDALSFLDMPDEEIDLHEAHISTKLDLARAYLDMGDIEGARSTLEEVMVEGNDNQRREAETLLHQTG